MNRIKELRLQKNISQSDLAENVRVTRQVISLYEKNLRQPSPKVWQALADYFGVSVDWLKGYGYSKDEIINFLIEGYNEGFTYQHSRDLDNEIMNAVALKTDNKAMQSLVKFQKEYGNLKALVDLYVKTMGLEIPKNKADKVKFFNDNFELLFNAPEVQRLLHATHSYTDAEVKETLLDALLNAMSMVYLMNNKSNQ